MSAYLIPIETALLTFPILAAIITIPYIIHQFRTYGSILPMRVLIIYSFIFYLLCAYFLVILPLPPIEEVAQYTKPYVQLIPFESLKEFSMYSSFIWNDPSTYWTALNEPSLFLIVFNILLSVPFGIYLRYYFHCSFKKTLLASFLLSLSFECIQLSALFGIYPRPYRVFDVDDLLTNTLGGVLGYGIAPIFSHFLPTRDALDEQSYQKGKDVSTLRQSVAFLLDFVLIILITAILFMLFALSTISYNFENYYRDIFIIYILVVSLTCLVLPIITKGKTIGKAIVNIRLATPNESNPAWYETLLHFFMLYIIIIPMPYYICLLIFNFFKDTTTLRYLYLLIAIIFIIGYSITLVQYISSLFHRDNTTWYEHKTRLKNISTILPEDEENDLLEEENNQEEINA
ncbi:MAG: VanZ family protein [Longicatena sp.]